MFVFILKNAVSLFLNTSKNFFFSQLKKLPLLLTLLSFPLFSKTVVSIAGCKDMYSFWFCNNFLKEIFKKNNCVETISLTIKHLEGFTFLKFFVET